MTLETLRWLTDVRAGFAQIDPDGRLVMTSAVVGNDDPRLRRTQALASTNGTDLLLSRDLIRRKIDGQARVVAGLDEGVSGVVHGYKYRLDEAASIQGIRSIEAEAALSYWQAWTDVEPRFDRRAAAQVPKHWRTFGQRGSALAAGARLATNPANAILNYCYALAEVEARLALSAVGLDPGLGVLHADQKSRDSMALDLLEAIRPEVDEWVLRLLHQQTFRAKDFRETRQGNCRILPPLTHALAETLPIWRRSVAPVTEDVARTFAADDTRITRAPTPLTGTNRSRRRPIAAARSAVDPSTLDIAPTCNGCGEPLPSRARRYCPGCATEIDLDSVFTGAGIAALAKMRAEGRDPSASGEAKEKVGKTNARWRRARSEWEAAHPEPPAPRLFDREILPGLPSVSVSRLAAATGLSLIYCSKVRRGLVRPHPMHWEAFQGSSQGDGLFASTRPVKRLGGWVGRPSGCGRFVGRRYSSPQSRSCI